MKIRTGIGVDVHQFAENREFWLGGVKIPYKLGLKGHSDADALIHAIMDALLGAAGLRDIGFYYPDNDNQFKDIRSTILLDKAYKLILDKGFKIGNIDSVICLQEPKINPFVPQMRTCIADILKIDEEDISIKATTFEKMGFVGNKEGILCFASCLILKD